MGLFSSKSKTVEDKPLSDAEIAELDTPWARANLRHEDTYLRLSAQVANWRMFAFMMIIISLISVMGNVYMGSLSKYIPMLVEVDKLGHTIAVRALTGDDAIKDSKRLAYREMFDLIENLRTVTTDAQANNTNIHRGFVRLKGAAKNYALTELRKAPPNEVGATKTVQVQIKSALPISDKTWQIEWVEHTTSLGGVEIKVENWKASIRYDLIPSGNEMDIRENPIGFTVTELNWMRVI